MKKLRLHWSREIRLEISYSWSHNWTNNLWISITGEVVVKKRSSSFSSPLRATEFLWKLLHAVYNELVILTSRKGTQVVWIELFGLKKCLDQLRRSQRKYDEYILIDDFIFTSYDRKGIFECVKYVETGKTYWILPIVHSMIRSINWNLKKTQILFS